MDNETLDIYNTIMSVADRIDKHTDKQKLHHESVREQLRMDLRDFLIFLTIADHVIAKNELRYINRALGYEFDYETLKRFAYSSKVMQDDYLNHPPESMKYFLEYDGAEDVLHETKYYDIKKLYILAFQSIGEDFLASCKHMDLAEVNQLTRFRFMLESQMRAYVKSGGVAPKRPDSIPFKLKLKEQTETESEPETKFIGRVSEGTHTMEDLDELLKELDGLIGLSSVKTEVRDLINLLKIIEMRRKNGLKAPSVTRHFVFAGNPGTGKTTVARLLSKIYCALGILSKGHMVEVDRSGLVAGYMGQTAIKVKEVVDRAKGGVLFIDEAYSLANETQGGDFGQEAIDTLVKAMEDEREDMIVIAAGYPDLMENFIRSNPGLKSRFQKTILFPDYTAEELYEVFVALCEENDYKLSPEAGKYLMEQLKAYVSAADAYFGNARDVRNFMDAAISAQANRLLAESDISPETLVTLVPQDLENVFASPRS